MTDFNKAVLFYLLNHQNSCDSLDHAITSKQLFIDLDF